MTLYYHSWYKNLLFLPVIKICYFPSDSVVDSNTEFDTKVEFHADIDLYVEFYIKVDA